MSHTIRNKTSLLAPHARKQARLVADGVTHASSLLKLYWGIVPQNLNLEGERNYDTQNCHISPPNNPRRIPYWGAKTPTPEPLRIW